MGTFAAPQSAIHFIAGSVIYASSFADSFNVFRLSVRCLAQAKGICPIFFLGQRLFAR